MFCQILNFLSKNVHFCLVVACRCPSLWKFDFEIERILSVLTLCSQNFSYKFHDFSLDRRNAWRHLIPKFISNKPFSVSLILELLPCNGILGIWWDKCIFELIFRVFDSLTKLSKYKFDIFVFFVNLFVFDCEPFSALHGEIVFEFFVNPYKFCQVHLFLFISMTLMFYFEFRMTLFAVHYNLKRLSTFGTVSAKVKTL